MTDTPLGRAQDALRVHDVYLFANSLWMADDFIPHLHSEALAPQSKHGVRDGYQLLDVTGADTDSEPLYRIVRFFLDTGFRFVAGATSDRPGEPADEEAAAAANTASQVRAEITATFCAEYQILASAIEADDDALRAFKDQNALYHVWPYWRELVQNTLARSRMPQVMLPMFRLPAADPQQEQ